MKWFAALLLMLMMIGTAMADMPADPVLFPADNLLPEGTQGAWLVDDSLIVAELTEGTERRRLLLNLDTGERIPLALSEDFVPQGGLMQRLPQTALIAGEPQASEGRYALVYHPAMGLALDKQTGRLHSVALPTTQLEKGRIGMTAWDQIWLFSGRTLSLTGIDGQQVADLTLDNNGEQITGVFPLPDGFMVLCAGETERMIDGLTSVRMTTAVFTDRELNLRSVVNLAGLPYAFGSRMDSECLRSSASGKLLLSPDGLSGLLQLSEDGRKQAVLSLTDGLVGEWDASVLPEMMIAAPVNLSGISADGSFALLHIPGMGLLRLDLGTNRLSWQMLQADLDAIGLKGGKAGGIVWPGGEYAAHDGVLYRFIDRTELYRRN